MIGGQDIIVHNPGSSPGQLLDGLTRLVRGHWPKLVFEDATTGSRFEHFWQIPFQKLSEVMLYRDTDAWKSWERLGADPSNANQMIHILASDASVTFVVDDAKAPAMSTLLASLRSFVDRSPFFGLGQFKHAA